MELFQLPSLVVAQVTAKLCVLPMSENVVPSENYLERSASIRMSDLRAGAGRA